MPSAPPSRGLMTVPNWERMPCCPGLGAALLLYPCVYAAETTPHFAPEASPGRSPSGFREVSGRTGGGQGRVARRDVVDLPVPVVVAVVPRYVEVAGVGVAHAHRAPARGAAAVAERAEAAAASAATAAAARSSVATEPGTARRPAATRNDRENHRSEGAPRKMPLKHSIPQPHPDTPSSQWGPASGNHHRARLFHWR